MSDTRSMSSKEYAEHLVAQRQAAAAQRDAEFASFVANRKRSSEPGDFSGPRNLDNPRSLQVFIAQMVLASWAKDNPQLIEDLTLTALDIRPDIRMERVGQRVREHTQKTGEKT